MEPLDGLVDRKAVASGSGNFPGQFQHQNDLRLSRLAAKANLRVGMLLDFDS